MVRVGDRRPRLRSPYNRQTYRYTPLLAVLLLPNHFIHPSFGKYLFAACDLVNGVLIYRLLLATVSSRSSRDLATNDARPHDEQRECGDVENTPIASEKAWAAFLAATHLFNPLVFSISTRGSSESILCTLVLLTLYYALHHRWDAAAVMLGISTHWKIYPFIYGVSCVTAIAAQTRTSSGWGFTFVRSLMCTRTLRFAILSAGTFFLLGIFCYVMYVFFAFFYRDPPLTYRGVESPTDGDTRSCTKPICIIQTASITDIIFPPTFTLRISPTLVNLLARPMTTLYGPFFPRSQVSSHSSRSHSARVFC